MPERLSQDMLDLIELLNKHRAQYLIIGAHAVGMYAEPRSTKDLDIWVNPTNANAKRVMRALKDFGSPLFGATEQTLAEKNSFLSIGVAPNRIDILKSVPGVEFNACWRKRQTLEVGGAMAHFIDVKNLIAAKEAANRPQDQADVAKLREALDTEPGS